MDTIRRSRQVPPKKPYEAPKLIVHEPLRDITKTHYCPADGRPIHYYGDKVCLEAWGYAKTAEDQVESN